jgi:hypothetical protein
VTGVGFGLAGMMFWNPVFSGCDAGCPANVLLIGAGSRPAWNAVNTISGSVGLVLTGIVVALIVQHWRSARLVPAGHGPAGVDRRRGRDGADPDRESPHAPSFRPGQLLELHCRTHPLVSSGCRYGTISTEVPSLTRRVCRVNGS